MAQIYGQIESLKQIRNHLNLKGIDKFNSINEINTFLNNYESEKIAINNYFENEFESDINVLKEKIKYNHYVSEKIKKDRIKKLDTKIRLNLHRLVKYNKNNKDSFLAKYFKLLIVTLLDTRVKYFQNNYENIISKSTNKIKKKINSDTIELNEFINNRENIITERSVKKLKQLAYTKEVILELNHLIAGAIGENLVVKELKKLSDKYILFNDFSVDFERPIYYKKDNNRISSIQIDHLLVTNSGLFIIETKNWSKKSIESPDLRSPVKQIDRTSFALYATLTYSRQLRAKLNSHHWGEKAIPIRKIVVMINQKPKEKFKFVKVTTLNELNRYITYFDPIFDDSEVKMISKYLKKKKN